MVCNTTAPVDAQGLSPDVCGGVGQCLPVDDGECTCPKGYSVLFDCEVTHYGLLPSTALVTSVVFLIPFVVLSFVYTYEYIWNFVKRPRLRLSILQVFNLAMTLFCYTRAWGCIHFLVNSRIGHTKVWAPIARQLTVSVGLVSMLFALAMVVSLWYDMVLSIRRINAKKSKSAKYIRIGLFVGGIISAVIGVAGAIYGLFLKTTWVTLIYTVVFVIYAGTFFTIASISIHKSRSIWCGPKGEESKAKREFTWKVKVMIGWICIGIIEMISGLFFNSIGSHEPEFFFISFSFYNVLELALALLSLLFNQHYVYPFAGFNCCVGGPDSDTATVETTGSRSRFSTAKASRASSRPSSSSRTPISSQDTSQESEIESNQSNSSTTAGGDESIVVSQSLSLSITKSGSSSLSSTTAASTSTQGDH
eukprot:TRINITY_DN236_c0_g3_i1.p1 TRINITY_DN236_c0_g3~~TRINITY_DN236_c0_g3_i1.p1  ORF type:complete len:420 (-),score=55.58 TRINITY_DN236_c0_g3_i1:98-1357(-)